METIKSDYVSMDKGSGILKNKVNNFETNINETNDDLLDIYENDQINELDKDKLYYINKEEQKLKQQSEKKLNDEEDLWYNPEYVTDISIGVKKRLRWIMLICFIFICVEVIGGLISGSLAILADASHLCCDIIGFALSYYAVHLGQKGRTREYTYGLHRAEVLGAMFSVLLILILAGFLTYFAVLRVLHPPTDFNPPYMLGTAIFGLCANFLMGYILWRTEQDPEDLKIDEDLKKQVDEEMKKYGKIVNEELRKATEEKAKKGGCNINENENANIRAAFVHILGDIVQSFGVCIASIIIMIEPTWLIVDPICTFVFASIVSYTTYDVMKSCMRVLCEGTPEEFDILEFEDELRKVKNVKRVLDQHVWNMTHGKVAMSAIIEGDESCKQVLRNSTLVCRKYGIYHSTIQVMGRNELTPGSLEYTNIGQNIHEFSVPMSRLWKKSKLNN